MDRVIAWRQGEVRGTVALPASKSISNRALIINALSESSMPVENLSDSDDTRMLARALVAPGDVVHVGQAGTAMRFLTAYFAVRGGVGVLTGSGRMKQRPIGGLVDALRELGAWVDYLEQPGFPPVSIHPARLTGGRELWLDASVSSQYVSALMMVGPRVAGGLVIRLTGNVVSGSYIRMTAGMMRYWGVDVLVEGDRVMVPEGEYVSRAFRVEADWSAASYFYEMLAIAGEGEIYLPGLMLDSLQGDACQVALWKRLGVLTVVEASGVRLLPGDEGENVFEADFTGMPDVALSFAVACCVKGRPFHLRGLETLYIKECDRVTALARELRKLGYVVEVPVHGELCWNRERNTLISRVVDTYEDHRMAMAFAPVAWLFPGLEVRDAGVVSKSFPGFWEQWDGLTR